MDSDVTRGGYVTTDPAVARTLLDRVGAGGRVRWRRCDGRFRLELQWTATECFSLGRLRGATLATDATALDDVLVVGILCGGDLRLDHSGYDDASAVAGGVILAPPGGAFRATLHDADVDTVVLGRGDVARYAEELCGFDPALLRFTDLVPLSERAAEHWRATVAHVRDTVVGVVDGARLNPVIADTAFRLLAAALLSCFPNNALPALAESGQGEAPRPHGPVGSAGDAASARALWHARLRGAHRDLDEADPAGSASVAGVAARWGFADVGTFAVAYTKAHHGETPGQTLRR